MLGYTPIEFWGALALLGVTVAITAFGIYQLFQQKPFFFAEAHYSTR